MRKGGGAAANSGIRWAQGISLVVILLAAAAVTAIALKRDFADLNDLGNSLGRTMPQDGALKVVVLGDSWAAGQKVDDQLTAALRSRGHTPEVSSFGVPGAKTKDILRHLRDPRKSGGLIDGGDVDYAVIFAGVNDSNGHDGPDFYRHHIDGILRVVRGHGAVPVVLDIPDFGVGQMPAPSWAHDIKRMVFRMLFDSHPPGNLSAYRKAVREVLVGERNAILLAAQVLPSFNRHPELWRDPAHLNAQGYAQVAETIADAIHAHIAATHDTVTP